VANSTRLDRVKSLASSCEQIKDGVEDITDRGAVEELGCWSGTGRHIARREYEYESRERELGVWE
jgi:hypothetical protein